MSRKNPQDMGYFLKPSGENLTGTYGEGKRTKEASLRAYHFF